MKRLILITDVFPFGKGEKSFIMPELEYLKKEFNVTILSRAPLRISEVENDITLLEPDIELLHYPEPELTRKIKLLYLFRVLFAPEFINEIRLILKEHVSFCCIKETYWFWVRAILLEKWMKRGNLFSDCSNTIFYSYWGNHSVLALARAKRKNRAIKFISRIHGYDLYHERFSGGRQPFKKYIDFWIDRVIFIAQVGYEYYLKHHSLNGSIDGKYYICRMGVRKPFGYPQRTDKSIFRMVSCSTVSELKRVDLIVKALASLEFEIEWHHFGDGREMETVKGLAQNLLDEHRNIRYCFHGHTSNEEVLKFYQNHWVDCFITTSSSEGCPVSIQEALSYGIPIIGTDVGEIRYMISGNGYLVSANPTVDEITEKINELFLQVKTDDNILRQNSLELWEKNYQLEKNTHSFITILKNM